MLAGRNTAVSLTQKGTGPGLSIVSIIRALIRNTDSFAAGCVGAVGNILGFCLRRNYEGVD